MAKENKTSKPIVVSVAGHGLTEDEATQSALRKAIEQTFGVYVYSTTTVKNYRLEDDFISTTSKGFIKKYTVLMHNKAETSQEHFVSLIKVMKQLKNG